MRKYVLDNDNFDVLDTEGDINSANDVFVNVLGMLTDKFVPKVKPRVKEKPLWLNSSVKQAIVKKHTAWNRYQKTRSQKDRDCYRKARNEVTRVVSGAKRDFECKLISELSCNPKSFWRYVQSKTKFKPCLSSLEKPDGGMAVSDAEKAETLNNFFASVFTHEDLSNVPVLDTRIHDVQLDTVIFTEQVVKDVILKLDQTKSPGPDNVQNRILKEIVDCVSKPLADLFTMSMSKGDYVNVKR